MFGCRSISLPSNGLTGMLPDSLGALGSLLYVALGVSCGALCLGGTFARAHTLGFDGPMVCWKRRTLDLHDNAIAGTIPDVSPVLNTTGSLT